MSHDSCLVFQEVNNKIALLLINQIKVGILDRTPIVQTIQESFKKNILTKYNPSLY